MEDFYSIEENFKYLYNNIYILLSDKIVESTVAENWLANWYMCNKYNTTRAVERCAADLIIPRLKESEIPSDEFRSIIDRKLNGCCESYNDVEYTLEDKKYLIENIQKVKINESTFAYIIQDFECDDIVEYIKENYFNDEYHTTKLSSLNEESKEILNIISHIKNRILESKDNVEDLTFVRDCNTSILYKYKYVSTESYSKLNEMYSTLENLLENQNDKMIDYTLDELNHCNKLIEYLLIQNSDEPTDQFIYEQAVEKFNSLVESIFFENIDNDIELDQMVELYQITEALCEYESTLEASSRIISRGTEKVTRAIGNKSAKSRGMSAAGSTVGQIKRGAKIIDDRASGAINNKIDQIINFGRDMKREKLIEGKNTIRVSKVLKAAIAIIAAKGLIKSHPLVGTAITLIGLLGARGLSKATEVREKRRIMLELETELKITREKIEDAKAENAKEKKYQLMRIENELEKEIFRIKHGMKYF
jgi:hypothetical protein